MSVCVRARTPGSNNHTCSLDVDLLHTSSLALTHRDAFGELDLADLKGAEVAPSRCHTHTMLAL